MRRVNSRGDRPSYLLLHCLSPSMSWLLLGNASRANRGRRAARCRHQYTHTLSLPIPMMTCRSGAAEAEDGAHDDGMGSPSTMPRTFLSEPKIEGHTIQRFDSRAVCCPAGRSLSAQAVSNKHYPLCMFSFQFSRIFRVRACVRACVLLHTTGEGG